ncbi:hypothetical protein ES288_A13G197600v1 [Gossypium darwinii]|uniref:Uncharacterized protein n=1 Tax=Gossypium darwinii TaxID=34276 RepID=A0A5D2E1I2_GOSDA|nr:hypothetical protein ES288_A13G197600v1 [Gossypium darwinii]
MADCASMATGPCQRRTRPRRSSTESVGIRTGCGRGVRGLWRYGTVVVGVWGRCSGGMGLLHGCGAKQKEGGT